MRWAGATPRNCNEEVLVGHHIPQMFHMFPVALWFEFLHMLYLSLVDFECPLLRAMPWRIRDFNSLKRGYLETAGNISNVPCNEVLVPPFDHKHINCPNILMFGSKYLPSLVHAQARFKNLVGSIWNVAPPLQSFWDILNHGKVL